jgi:hypothetical protein
LVRVAMAGCSMLVSGLWRNAVCSAYIAVVYRCLAGEWRKLLNKRIHATLAEDAKAGVENARPLNY